MSPRGGKRIGAGRPRELRQPVTVAFRVERRMAEAAEKIAAARGITLSELMREVVSRLKRRKGTGTREGA